MFSSEQSSICFLVGSECKLINMSFFLNNGISRIPVMLSFAILDQIPMELLLGSKEADLPWDDISNTDGVTCWLFPWPQCQS